ncbi:MAG: hypothetical protein WCN27_03875, partial [Alphaproteobacteria bacterium]
SYNKIITEGTESKYIISENKNSCYFNIEEAIRFFIQPVSIILENSLNDQYLLRAIIKYFDSTKEVQRQLDNGWIQFENAGGCGNVENFIKGKLQSFNNYTKNKHIYLRCFVLLDSDKEYPNAPIKTTYSNLSHFLNNHHVKYHILEKRCMENYMPDTVFDYIANTPELKNWLAAYAYLNEEQKDFLNISIGFSKKDQFGTSIISRSSLKQEVQLLYSNISQPNYEELDKGFKLANFKTEFPKQFEHHQVHKNTLDNRCGNNEFKDILDKIAALL